MFSFHKPKIYRSMQGCCICRAKSSSSRFTDSKRYENDFIKCFEILERRSGEICNACVLLVKRWKKLPADSTRNWRHVVDARAGPGTKSMNKIKNKAKMEEKLLKKKHKHKHKKPMMNKPNASPGANCRSSGGLSDDVADDYSERSSQSGSFLSDGSDDEGSSSQERVKGSKRRKRSNPLQHSSFLDLNYWKRTEVCCGVVFKGPRADVVIDMSLYNPCKNCKDPLPKDMSAEAEAVSSSPCSPSAQDKSEHTQGVDAARAEESNDADDDIDDDDDLDDLDDDEEDMDDDDDDEIVEELDLDEDMIGGLEELEEDEGTDSGLGSQEMSTAGGSPSHQAPAAFQTAAAMLHAMSTGADLLPSESSSDNKTPIDTATSSRVRNFSGEQQEAAATSTLPSPSSSSLHSAAAVTPSVVPSVVSAAQSCIQIQMAV